MNYKCSYGFEPIRRIEPFFSMKSSTKLTWHYLSAITSYSGLLVKGSRLSGKSHTISVKYSSFKKLIFLYYLIFEHFLKVFFIFEYRIFAIVWEKSFLQLIFILHWKGLNRFLKEPLGMAFG
jgi:hypothetical protein